ncbi:MAG: biotin/lipoyl-binding protein [Limisphaerales bacterium]
MKSSVFSENSWLTRLTGRLLGLAIILGSIVLVAYISREHYRQPRTNDANVRANIVGIAPNVAGQIVELNVVDNQEVNEGDVLFVIDPRPYEIELERSKANLLLTQTQISATSNAVTAAQMDIRRLEAENAYAADHVQRLEPLLAKKFVTTDDLQSARSTARSADASLAQARAELSRQENLLGQIDDINAYLKVSEAAVHSAELNLQYCRVRSPFKGRVTNLNISKGEYAKAGTQVFALVDTRHWYVMANFQETYLAAIQPGMEAEVYLMSYPNRKFHGRVQGLGWAIQSPDATTPGVLPTVEPTLNWTRLAQRIPVRIELEEGDAKQPYRMGMTAMVILRQGRDEQPAAPAETGR